MRFLLVITELTESSSRAGCLLFVDDWDAHPPRIENILKKLPLPQRMSRVIQSKPMVGWSPLIY